MVEGKGCCIAGFTNVKQSLYQMAGSKGGKHPKRKGKSMKSDTINKEPGVSNSKLELEHYLNMDQSGSRDPEDKNPQPDANFALSASRFSYTEHELEDFLHLKIELLYAKVKEELLKLGYSMETVETAIIHAGYIHGPKDLLDNILVNSLAYIEKKVEPKKEAFQDMNEFYVCICETMIQKMIQYYRCTQRSDAVWFLLISNWGIFPSTTTTSHLQRGDMNMYVHGLESSSTGKNGEAGTPNLSSDAVWNKTSDPVTMPSARGKEIEVSDIVSSDFLRPIAGCSDDPKTALMVDLVKDLRELQEKMKEKKKWAEKKAMDSERRLHKHIVELNTLRMEMIDKEKIKKKIAYAEKCYILMLIEKEQSLQQANSEASFHTESMRMLEMDNAQMRADTEALKLGASEYEEDLREVLKREKRCIKNRVSFEKQASILHSQTKEEKQRLLQLEAELLRTDKEGDKVEKKWRHGIREKERILALLPEQIRMVEIQRANSRAELLKFQQNIEIDSQLPRDDLRRLEDELTFLHISREKQGLLQIDEASSSTSGPDESCEKGIRQWMCMLCLKNEVSIIFLPCKHQVICSPCYSQSFKTVVCPYCRAQIEEIINVYGPSS